MGGEYMPKELQELQQKYRLFFDKNQEETDAVKKIKEEILNYESENSSFFQNLKFESELR